MTIKIKKHFLWGITEYGLVMPQRKCLAFIGSKIPKKNLQLIIAFSHKCSCEISRSMIDC